MRQWVQWARVQGCTAELCGHSRSLNSHEHARCAPLSASRALRRVGSAAYRPLPPCRSSMAAMLPRSQLSRSIGYHRAVVGGCRGGGGGRGGGGNGAVEPLQGRSDLVLHADAALPRGARSCGGARRTYCRDIRLRSGISVSVREVAWWPLCKRERVRTRPPQGQDSCARCVACATLRLVLEAVCEAASR